MPRKGEQVYHRKNGLWEARYVKGTDDFGKKQYGSVYARSYREVKEKRQNALDNLLLYQTPTGVRHMTVAHLVKEWLCVNRQRLKESTFQRYEGFWQNHIEKMIGQQSVLSLSTVSLHRFAMNRLEAGLLPQSVNTVLVFLHACLKYGHRQYKTPLPEIVYLTCPPQDTRSFSSEEEQRLVSYLLKEMDVYKFGALFALYTGLRLGELCALHWEDVTDESVTVSKTVQRLKKQSGSGTELVITPPKTKSSMRTIPFPSFLLPYIQAMRQDKKERLYFLSSEQIPMVEPRVMQYRFRKYLSALQIEHASFHTLRHTFATRATECQFEITALSQVLGHASPTTTLKRYVHPSMEFKRCNMERLKIPSVL